eukprot:TRINITY_DN1942_c0_g1_i2.p1 TRINITY_DN1942_c0_g1~~TRINITY_DN1942_c0_g1_i2.p1  ORF type:complete len:295 (+),score=82.88 TRINITY_DN1942_c0_g1_i2:34-918(+)
MDLKALKISPADLVFLPPFTKPINNSIKLTNTSAEALSYKVKTTAPKRYTVKPNTGTILPNESVEVTITLNFTKDPPANPKVADKFQIQCIPVADTTADLKTLWSRVPKEQVLKYKLRCYLSAKETAEEHSTRDTIDQSEFEDASEHEDKKDHPAASVTSPVVSQPVPQQPSTPVTEPVKPTPAPVTPLATNKVQSVAETNKGQLSPRAKYKLEIEKQRLEIDRLKADLDKYRNNESGLRQRKVGGGSESSTADQGMTSGASHATPVTGKMLYIGLALLFLFGVWFGRWTKGSN